jgi:molecular chaperone DnaK
MVKDAEAHAAEDKQRREQVDAHNAADSLAYQARKMLHDLGDKLDEASRGEVLNAIADVEQALKGEDIANLKRTSEALSAALHKASQKAYEAAGKDSAAGGGKGAGAGAAGESGAERPVDADYEVVEDEGKA